MFLFIFISFYCISKIWNSNFNDLTGYWYLARFGNESVMISNSSCRYFTHEYVFDYIHITFNYCTILSSISISLFNDLSQNPNKKNIVYIWNWLNVAGVYPIYIGMNVYKFNSWKHSSRHTFIRLSYVCVCVSVQASGVGIQMTLRLIAGIVGHTCGQGIASMSTM